MALLFSPILHGGHFRSHFQLFCDKSSINKIFIPNKLVFESKLAYCSVLISMIDFKFNVMQTKFAMLAVSRLSL